MDKVNNYQEELIERYFSKTLDAAQIIEFEKKIQTDKAFAENVAFQYATRKALILPNSNFQEEVFASAAKEDYNSSRMLYFGIAAVAAMLAAIVFFYGNFQPPHNVSIEGFQIPLANFESMSSESKSMVKLINPFLVPYLPSGRSAQLKSYVQYKNRTYQAFLELVPNELTSFSPPDSYHAEMLKATAELFSGNLKVSEQMLQGLLNDPAAKAFYNEAHYYLALAFLHQEKIEAAKQNLYAIKNGPKRKLAKNMLNVLEQGTK